MTNKLSIVCVSGTLEKLQMASMVASVAAASGDEVTVFFSMNALQYFTKDNAELAAPEEGEFGRLIETEGVPAFRKLFEQAADLDRRVGNRLLMVRRQGMHDQIGLAHLKGDDVVELAFIGVHAHGAVRSSWIICGCQKPLYRSDGRKGLQRGAR